MDFSPEIHGKIKFHKYLARQAGHHWFFFQGWNIKEQ